MQNSLWDIWNNKVIRTYYNILPFKYSSWSTSFHSVLHLSLSVFSLNILHFGWKFLKEANAADLPYRHKTAVSAEDIRRMHRKAHVVLTAISCHKQTGRQCLPLRSCEQTGWCVWVVWIHLPSSFGVRLSWTADGPGTPCQPWTILYCQPNIRQTCSRKHVWPKHYIHKFLFSLKKKLGGVTDLLQLVKV